MSVQLLETKYGRMLSSDTDIGQYDWLRIAGVYWEHFEIEEVRNILSERRRGTFVDVGASFGCWTMAMVPHVERVVAFEPQLPVYHMLCGSLALNHLDRKVELHNCALWSKRCELTIPMPDFAKPDTNSGGISVLPQHAPELPREPIQAYRLYDFISPDEHVSFIKMDVEGAEYEVLLGSLEILARCRPVLFIESDCIYTDKPKLARQIQAMDYIIERRDMNFLCVPF